MDDASTQFGRLTVDGLTFTRFPDNRQIPLIQISDNNPTGEAESHFRNVHLLERKDGSKRALVDRGGGARPTPITAAGVPVYLHDQYGPGRTAKVESSIAANLVSDGTAWKQETPLTGDESVVTEVRDVPFPKLLDPVDDLAPATMITGARLQDGKLNVTGITHDNGDIAEIVVNGQPAEIVSMHAGVADWRISLKHPDAEKVIAFAKDKAGNREQTAHEWVVDSRSAPGAIK
jgi:hypothetical protein